MTHLDLFSVLVDITIIFIVRERVRTHEIHFVKEFFPSLVLSRKHSILSLANQPITQLTSISPRDTGCVITL
jgi:hypothetical protein